MWLKKSPRIALLCCLALVLAACDDETSQGPRPALVSDKAAFAVIVEKPAALLTGAAELWDAADLDKSYGSDLMGFLIKNIPRVDEFALAVDRGRPLALVYLPLTPGSNELTTLFLLPVREGQEKVAADLPMGKLRFAGIREGYALFTDGAEGDDASLDFPPAAPLDLSALSRYPADSIKLWASPSAFASATGGGFTGLEESGRRFVSPSGPEAEKAMVLDWGLSILDDLGAADGAIVVSRSGIALKAQVRATAGSGMERLILLGAKAPDARDWAGQVESRALLGMAWSSTPEFDAAISDFALSIPGSGGDGELLAKRDLYRDLEARALGSRGAFSMDLGLDQDALGGLDGNSTQEEIRLAIDRYFRFDLELLGELNDAEAMTPLIDAILADESVDAAIQASAQEQGLLVDLSSSHRASRGFVGGRVGLTFGIADASRLGIAGSAQASIYAAILDSFSEKFTFDWAARGSRFALANADADTVEGLATRARARRSIEDDPAFRAFASTFPSRVQYLVSFSTQRLMGLVKSTLSPDMVDPTAFDCWYAYLSNTESDGEAVLEIGLFVPAGDIRATLEAITAPPSRDLPKGKKS